MYKCSKTLNGLFSLNITLVNVSFVVALFTTKWTVTRFFLRKTVASKIKIYKRVFNLCRFTQIN